jgi:arylsulfatase A-like enzyme
MENTSIFGNQANWTRRHFLASAGAPAVLAAPRTDRPNIVVIVLDDLGCKDLGYLGAADLKTPNIDRLAAGGARCLNWYSNAPVCAPARSSILSGRHPANAGVPDNGRALLDGIPTLASVFKDAGYRTGAVGKWHLGSTATSRPNARGFDSFFGFHSGCVDFYSHRFYWGEPRTVNYHDLWRNTEEIFEDGRYLTELITEEALDFINRHRREPFLAYVAYNAPHYPMHAPAKYKERLAALDPERRTYGAMIAAVDDGAGAIRSALERESLLENTLLFLLGDNGATTEKCAGLGQNDATAGRNGIFKGFKFSLFDGGMHVPGLVHYPAKIRGGRDVKELVQSMDILPTACRAATVPAPAGIDGSDVLAVLAEEARSPHESLFWHSGGQLAVRRGRWKLVIDGRLHDRSPDGGKPLTGEDALWLSDLDEDPGETKNLRRLHPNLVDELATLAARWRDSLRQDTPR